MATQLFLLSAVPDIQLATRHTGLWTGSAVGWSSKALGTARGGGVVASGSQSTNTGPVNGIEAIDTSPVLSMDWISPPVAADVTISGTITANIWASESSMSANVAINVVIEIIRANVLGTVNSNTLVQIVKSTRTTEEAVTTRAAANFTTGMTSGAYSSQTLNRGDRLRVRVIADDGGGNMATGFTFNMSYNGSSASADGDTYVTFTEDFSFESAPAGSVLYLTDTASAVSTASVDREAWTSRGSGATTITTTAVTGPTTPIQMTQTAGGTVVDWFTRPLTAFTLAGMALANLRVLAANTNYNGSVRCQIARVDGDGTNPTVWADWGIAALAATDGGEPSTSEAARTSAISGDDLAISDGQRLRIRVFASDASVSNMNSAGTSVSLVYGGTSGGASGDTYITLPQTVTEYTPPATGGPALRRHRRASRFLTTR